MQCHRKTLTYLLTTAAVAVVAGGIKRGTPLLAEWHTVSYTRCCYTTVQWNMAWILQRLRIEGEKELSMIYMCWSGGKATGY